MDAFIINYFKICVKYSLEGKPKEKVQHKIQEISERSRKQENKGQQNYKTKLFQHGHSFDFDRNYGKKQFRSVQWRDGYQIEKGQDDIPKNNNNFISFLFLLSSLILNSGILPKVNK